jgi:hypothetical protein
MQLATIAAHDHPRLGMDLQANACRHTRMGQPRDGQDLRLQTDGFQPRSRLTCIGEQLIRQPRGLADRDVEMVEVTAFGLGPGQGRTTADDSMEPRVAPASLRGVSLGLFASTTDYDYGQLLDEIVAVGATDVMLVVPLRLPTSHSGAVRLGVPADAVQRALRQARQRSLQVSVMPILELDVRAARDDWRGRIDPVDPDLFWSNYGAQLHRIASWSEREGAVRLVVGSELVALEAEADRWEGLITEVRDRFTGVLVYSANWDHHREVPFWDAVDEVGITAYFPVHDAPERAWNDALDAFGRFAAERGKPLVLTEYGYPAIESAPGMPWDETTGAALAPDQQAELLDASLGAIATSEVQTAFLWNWFGHGGAHDPGFSPRHRAGADVVRRHFQTPPFLPEGSP